MFAFRVNHNSRSLNVVALLLEILRLFETVAFAIILSDSLASIFSNLTHSAKKLTKLRRLVDSAINLTCLGTSYMSYLRYDCDISNFSLLWEKIK